MAPQALRRSSGWLADKDEYEPEMRSVLPPTPFSAFFGMAPWQWLSSRESQHADPFFIPDSEDPTSGTIRAFSAVLSNETVVWHGAPPPVPEFRPHQAEFVELRLVLDENAARDMLAAARYSYPLEDDGLDPIEAAASVAARHPALARVEEGVRLVLACIAEHVDRLQDQRVDLARLLDEVRHALPVGTNVLDRAMGEILQETMLTEHEAARVLNARRAGDGSLEQYRSRSWLIGLPTDRGYRYPKFQFDQEQSDVYEVVRDVNEMLDAAEDPWGVASWWFTPVARLGGRPADLVGLRDDTEIIAASKALLAQIG